MMILKNQWRNNMLSFEDALKKGFTLEDFDSESLLAKGYYRFVFGDDKEYELCFEPLIFDTQYYVALYENQELLTEKVVVNPGKEVSKEKNFEDYLIEVFMSEEPQVLDDDLPDAFDAWIEKKDANDILELVKKYEAIKYEK